jgi:exosortase/archaeosortase family protein
MQLILKTAARPLLQRTAAFLVICLLWSGLIGPRIISNGILARGHFDIYGGLGKAMLFGVVALALLIRHKGYDLKLPSWKQSQGLWLVALAASLAAFVSAWLVVNKLIDGAGGWYIPAAHILLLTSIGTAAIGCFGWPSITLLFKSYKKQLGISAALAAAFYLFLLAVYAAWQPLSTIVLHSVHWLFNIVGLHSVIVPPRSLLFDKFGIEIAQYCSGIESIALFTGLFALIALLDWDKLNHRKIYAIFLPALILLFACNILRVFALIAAGYYINPQIAFSLFHTYAGMVFFIIYSGVFWTLAYKWLLVAPTANNINSKSSRPVLHKG